MMPENERFTCYQCTMTFRTSRDGLRLSTAELGCPDCGRKFWTCTPRPDGAGGEVVVICGVD